MNAEKIEAYESAYPGSMSEREDGGFVRRDDAESLAGSLLAIIKSGDRAAEDLQDALTEAKKDAARAKEELALAEETIVSLEREVNMLREKERAK